MAQDDVDHEVSQSEEATGNEGLSAASEPSVFYIYDLTPPKPYPVYLFQDESGTEETKITRAIATIIAGTARQITSAVGRIHWRAYSNIVFFMRGDKVENVRFVDKTNPRNPNRGNFKLGGRINHSDWSAVYYRNNRVDNRGLALTKDQREDFDWYASHQRSHDGSGTNTGP